jgi:hypothetical protein
MKERTMHDIDRTTLEYGQETGPYANEAFEFQEFGGGGALSEHEEIQFAHELLAVNNEQEFEQFLGDFLSKAVSTVSNIARSPIGQAIGGVLKGVASKALPMAGTALGGFIGGPLGAKIGGGLANAAGKALGLEYEMQESGELEFDGARQFVRLAADTARNAVAQAQSGVDPRKAAQSAAIAAAMRIAPGLLTGAAAPGTSMSGQVGVGGGMGGALASSMRPGAPGVPGHSGRWVRRGKHIVLFGV